MVYRSQAQLPIEINPTETFGLIRTPKAHECPVPGFWTHAFYALTFRPIHLGAVFRCPHCRSVRKYSSIYPDGSYPKWTATNSTEWLNAGGVAVSVDASDK